MIMTTTSEEANVSNERTIQLEAMQLIGPQRDSLATIIPLTILLTFIFISGVLGNVCTLCIVYRNRYMHTKTNFYLVSLAISDLLLLLLGLPQELFMLWQKYPYVFGEFFCVVRGLSSETSTNASILTITAFTIERYVAICHPLRSYKLKLGRVFKTILLIWAISLVASLPVAFQFGVISLVDQKRLQNISRICGVKTVLFEYGFETTAIVFFLMPITLISVLYVLIGINLRRSANQIKSEPSLAPKEMLAQYHESNHSESVNLYQRNNSVCCSSQHKQIASRRSVIRMLVAVVVAFFFCYSPFHAQRVLASMMTRFNIKSKTYYLYHVVLTHISGVTYYLSATINPILYQLMSRKFRIAFRDTFGHCLPCVGRNLPVVTYANIVGGASSHKLTRTGSFYSNGSFRRSSINLEACTPIVLRKCHTAEQLAVSDVTASPEKQQQQQLNVSIVAQNSNSGSSSFDSSSKQRVPHGEMHPSPQRRVTQPAETGGTMASKNHFLNVPSFKF